MTYTGPTVSAPARLPWDVPAIVTAALDVLRLDPTDDDAGRIADAAQSATELLDSALDYAVAPTTIPGPVITAAVNLTVELYRRKDAPFGVTDAWSVDGTMVRLSSDVLRGVSGLIRPYRSRRGLA